MTPRVPADPRRPLLLVAGLVVLLCVATLVVGGPYLFHGRQEPAEAARVATAVFLGRLEAADYPGAYDQLCADTRGRVSRDGFVASAAGRPAVVGHAIESAVVDDAADGGPVVVVTASVTDATGAATPQDFRVVADAGAWRVCGTALPT